MPEESSLQDDLEALRSAWKTLYSSTLPSLARAKDPAQPKWPVTLDHCFARIILDNTVGATSSSQSINVEAEVVPWDTVIGRPAVRQMDANQLRTAIDLGEKIQKGDVDLVELDRRSLVGRGKSKHKYGSKETKGDSNGVKRKRSDEIDEQDVRPLQSRNKDRRGKKQSTLVFKAESNEAKEDSTITKGNSIEDLECNLNVKSTPSRGEILNTLKRIDTDKSLTPFRKRLYTSLLSVPRGEYTNYAALATHLGSIARAVGNGMRNNPFAPDVPCHRVLASDGSIGGFGGDWARDGKPTDKQEKKMKLLKEEGVKFDSTGKVKGRAWDGFWDREDFVKEYGDAS